MPCPSKNIDHLKPLDFEFLGADKAFNLREKNNAPPADEATWLQTARRQHGIISVVEGHFFDELDQRMGA